MQAGETLVFRDEADRALCVLFRGSLAVRCRCGCELGGDKSVARKHFSNTPFHKQRGEKPGQGFDEFLDMVCNKLNSEGVLGRAHGPVDNPADVFGWDEAEKARMKVDAKIHVCVVCKKVSAAKPRRGCCKTGAVVCRGITATAQSKMGPLITAGPSNAHDKGRFLAALYGEQGAGGEEGEQIAAEDGEQSARQDGEQELGEQEDMVAGDDPVRLASMAELLSGPVESQTLHIASNIQKVVQLLGLTDVEMGEVIELMEMLGGEVTNVEGLVLGCALILLHRANVLLRGLAPGDALILYQVWSGTHARDKNALSVTDDTVVQYFYKAFRPLLLGWLRLPTAFAARIYEAQARHDQGEMGLEELKAAFGLAITDAMGDLLRPDATVAETKSAMYSLQSVYYARNKKKDEAPALLPMAKLSRALAALRFTLLAGAMLLYKASPDQGLGWAGYVHGLRDAAVPHNINQALGFVFKVEDRENSLTHNSGVVQSIDSATGEWAFEFDNGVTVDVRTHLLPAAPAVDRMLVELVVDTLEKQGLLSPEAEQCLEALMWGSVKSDPNFVFAEVQNRVKFTGQGYALLGSLMEEVARLLPPDEWFGFVSRAGGLCFVLVNLESSNVLRIGSGADLRFGFCNAEHGTLRVAERDFEDCATLRINGVSAKHQGDVALTGAMDPVLSRKIAFFLGVLPLAGMTVAMGRFQGMVEATDWKFIGSQLLKQMCGTLVVHKLRQGALTSAGRLRPYAQLRVGFQHQLLEKGDFAKFKSAAAAGFEVAFKLPGLRLDMARKLLCNVGSKTPALVAWALDKDLVCPALVPQAKRFLQCVEAKHAKPSASAMGSGGTHNRATFNVWYSAPSQDLVQESALECWGKTILARCLGESTGVVSQGIDEYDDGSALHGDESFVSEEMEVVEHAGVEHAVRVEVVEVVEHAGVEHAGVVEVEHAVVEHAVAPTRQGLSGLILSPEQARVVSAAQEGKNVVWNGCCGKGKTWLTFHIAAAERGKLTLFAVPTRALADAVMQESQSQGIEAEWYMLGDQGQTPHWTPSKTVRVLVVVYDTAFLHKNLCDALARLDKPLARVVLDEVHEVISSAGFRSSMGPIRHWRSVVGNHTRVTILSGTLGQNMAREMAGWLQLEEAQTEYVLEPVRLKRDWRRVDFTECQSWGEFTQAAPVYARKAVQAAQRQGDAGQGGTAKQQRVAATTLVFCATQQLVDSVGKSLREDFPQTRIERATAKSTEEDLNMVCELLTKTRDVDLIVVATSVLAAGINMRAVDCVVVLGGFDAMHLFQCWGRCSRGEPGGDVYALDCVNEDVRRSNMKGDATQRMDYKLRTELSHVGLNNWDAMRTVAGRGSMIGFADSVQSGVCVLIAGERCFNGAQWQGEACRVCNVCRGEMRQRVTRVVLQEEFVVQGAAAGVGEQDAVARGTEEERFVEAYQLARSRIRGAKLGVCLCCEEAVGNGRYCNYWSCTGVARIMQGVKGFKGWVAWTGCGLCFAPQQGTCQPRGACAPWFNEDRRMCKWCGQEDCRVSGFEKDTYCNTFKGFRSVVAVVFAKWKAQFLAENPGAKMDTPKAFLGWAVNEGFSVRGVYHANVKRVLLFFWVKQGN